MNIEPKSINFICNFMEEFQLVAYNFSFLQIQNYNANRDRVCPVTFLLNKPS